MAKAKQTSKPKSKKKTPSKKKSLQKFSYHLAGLIIISLIIILSSLLIIRFALGKFTKSEYIQTKTYQFTPMPTSTASQSASLTHGTLAKVASKSSTLAAVLPASSGPDLHVPILTYHYIGSNPNPADTLRDNLSVVPDLFQAQMDYLQKNDFTPISLDMLFNSLNNHAPLPAKPIILTFDDGYIDFFLNAFPILEQYHFHATSFIPTGLIGKPAYMTWDQIKQIQGSGLVSFEAHSVTHPDLTRLSQSQTQDEITQSKKTLEAELGIPVNFFAYPYGTSNAQVWQAVKNAGFIGAVGTWYGVDENQGIAYDLPRIKIAGGTSVNTFATKL